SLFFFKAEDGIRDDLVTGFQTCALPISGIFVDWPHVEAGLKELNVCVEPEALADGLLRCASLLGEVTIARAYGPFNDGFANTNEIGRASCRKEGRAWERQDGA